MTPTQRAASLADKLTRAGLPPMECQVIGQYLHLTFKGEETAHRAARLVASVCPSVRVVPSLEEYKDQSGRPADKLARCYRVWRVAGRIQAC